jgi:hypothetical protein
VPDQMDVAFANVAATLGLAAGVVAALATVAGGFVAWRTHREDVVSQRINDVRAALLNLIDLRERFATLPPNDPNYDTTSGFLNQRRAIYLAVAKTLAGRVRGALSSDDYATLGWECQSALDYRCAFWVVTTALMLRMGHLLEPMSCSVRPSPRPKAVTIPT